MIVRCPSCEARFHLADGRLPEKGARVRCSKCHHRFYVRPPGTDAQGSASELEAESEPDAAPVSRQGKPAAPVPKSAKSGAAPKGETSAKGGATATGETTAKGGATARGGASAKSGATAKGATPAAAKPIAAKPAASPPKPAPKAESAKPARAPAPAHGGADDPDLEDPQFLFDKAEAEKPARDARRSAPKPAERAPTAATDALGGGAALFSDDDEDERAEATLGDEDAFVDHDARTDLFGDMAGLAAETEAADKNLSPPKPARPSAPGPQREQAPEPMPTLGEPEPMPSLDVKSTARAGSSYQTGGSREQVERRAAAPRAAFRPAAELPATSAPAPDTPRSRLFRALACAVGLALALVGGRLVASHGMGPFAGPERLAGPGWEVRGVEILRLRAAEGQVVLALRGTLDRTGSGALPALRATAADDRGRALGTAAPVRWTWLEGAELAPDRLSHWMATDPAPAPEAESIASARFTVLIANPPAGARRILLRAS